MQGSLQYFFCISLVLVDNLKSTTGLLILLPFHTTNITGDVWVVLFLDKILLRETSLAIYLSMCMVYPLHEMGNGLTKMVSHLQHLLLILDK